MPYGQYENTSFNGQTFTLGNVGLTGATGPNLVSSDPSKPVRVNGVIPGAGGGGGGDVFTSTNNTYDAGIVNTFQGNTVMTTVGATGKITCVALDAGNGKIQTLADVECEGLNAGNAKIETQDNVECDTVIATANVQCVDVVASGGITGQTLTSNGNLFATAAAPAGLINGRSIVSDSNVFCAASGNYFVGATQISSGNLLDVNNLLNTSATAQTKTGGLTSSGQLQGDTLISTNNITSLSGAAIINQNIQAGGDIVSTAGNMEARGGQLSLRSSDAGIIDDASRNLTVQSFSDTNKIFCGLGSGANKALQLDIVGTKARLQLYDYTAGRNQYYDVGQNPDELTGLIALINNSSLVFNGTTTTTFDAGSNVLLNGTTTVGGGASLIKTGFLGGSDIFTYVQNLRATPTWVGMPYVGAPTIFVDIVGRFPLEYYTETWGTNTKVFWRGATELRAGGSIAPQNIGSIPLAIRPTNPVIVSCQGQTLNDTCRITFETNGNVVFNGSNNPNVAIINFSQIEYFIN